MSTEGQSFTCQAGAVPALPAAAVGGPVQVKLLTYNLYWWKEFDTEGGWGAFGVITRSGQPQRNDVMAFQECDDISYVLQHTNLASEYEGLQGSNSLCLAYRRETWQALDHGQTPVASDRMALPGHPGRSTRDAQWVRLSHWQTKKVVFFMNHHGPLPINSGGACGGAVTAQNLLRIAGTHAQPGDAVVLVGDFNAAAGSQTLQVLSQSLHPVYRGVKDGGIDHVLSNLPMVSSANLGGGGSDHDALSVTLNLR
jgi:endonuclease/exonuclease/phosphatase family metal-dependent hydrolase